MYYLIILLVYAAVDAIACLGLSQQFGVAGVTNFGFILFQAAGAYVAAILALPPDTANGGSRPISAGSACRFRCRGSVRRRRAVCWPFRSPSSSAGGCAVTSPQSACW